MIDSLTYVYCLVRDRTRPVLRGLRRGVPRADRPRLLDLGDGLWAVVATVPARGYDEAAIADGLQNLDWVGRHAIAHEEVVERFLAAGAVLPMQLFTLFASDERAVEHVARDRARIDRILARISGRLEWGLRLTFDEKSARQALEQRHTAGDGASRSRADGGGVAYLAHKRDLRDVTRVELGEARAQADHLYRLMSREADESLRRPEIERAQSGSRLLLDAAFLVPTSQSSGFRAALRRHAKSLTSAGIVVSLTGPWPPYNFIDPRSHGSRRSRKSPARAPKQPRGGVARARRRR